MHFSMIYPSPDGLYVAVLRPKLLEIISTTDETPLFSIDLLQPCRSLVWDHSSTPAEYRLALAANAHVLAIGFDQNTSYHTLVKSPGTIQTVQWVPMSNSRGKLVPHLACTSSGSDVATVWRNDLNVASIIRPKTNFVSMPYYDGWALLHSAGTQDKVTFMLAGRCFGGLILPSNSCEQIAASKDAAIIAVADFSGLYLMGSTALLARAQGLIVKQMTWMSDGHLLVNTGDLVLRLSVGLNVVSVVRSDVSNVHAIVDKQLIELTNCKSFDLVSPSLVICSSGNFCAIHCKRSHFVMVVDAAGRSEQLIDYRDGDNLAIEWHGDELFINFGEYGIIWSVGTFKIVDFNLENCKFMSTNSGNILLWNEESYTTVSISTPQESIGNSADCGNSITSLVTEAENLEANSADGNTPRRSSMVSPSRLHVATPIELSSLEFELNSISARLKSNHKSIASPWGFTPGNLPELKIPSVSPYFNEHAQEDTFHYKRRKLPSLSSTHS